VFTGDVTRGRIESRDPNSLDIVHAFDAYSGGLTGFEVHGHYVRTDFSEGGNLIS
jgi:hypothetical protein